MFLHKPEANNDRVVIIKPWRVTNTQGIVLAIIVAFFGAVLSDVLQTYKIRFERRARLRQGHNQARRFGFWHIASSLIHVPLKGLNYLLMLLVMTYDGSLLTAVIIGAGFGYFIMDKWKRSDTNDGFPRLVGTKYESNEDGVSSKAQSSDNLATHELPDETVALMKTLKDNPDMEETTI